VHVAASRPYCSKNRQPPGYHPLGVARARVLVERAVHDWHLA
jgi:hypothetical protein